MNLCDRVEKRLETYPWMICIAIPFKDVDYLPVNDDRIQMRVALPLVGTPDAANYPLLVGTICGLELWADPSVHSGFAIKRHRPGEE